MALRPGFKSRANALARQYRQELGLTVTDPLCPWQLARHLGIIVRTLSSLKQVEEAVKILQGEGLRHFSGFTVGDGERHMIIHNDAHSIRRQANTIAHELSHLILGHPPLPYLNELGARHYNETQEKEADWLGPALLISDEAALYIVEQRWSEEQAARKYRVSRDVVRMRIRVTAARRRVMERQAIYDYET